VKQRIYFGLYKCRINFGLDKNAFIFAVNWYLLAY